MNRKRKLIRVGLAGLAVLLLAAAAALLLGSRRNRENNRELSEQFHRIPPSQAPADPLPEPDWMGLPDGSPITREVRLAQADELPDLVRSSVFHTEEGPVLPAMQELRKTVRDLCGWLEIRGLVDLPVVSRDNAYYLDHDAEGKASRYGALFLDEGHPVAPGTQNLLIHGHNMRDGSMFGFLTHYQNRGYLRRHPVATFTTLREKEDYILFAVLKVRMDPQDPDYLNYFTHASFGTDREFEDYIGALRQHSLVRTSIGVEPSDALLTLTTCVGEDYRLVLVGRRIRKGESAALLGTLIE